MRQESGCKIRQRRDSVYVLVPSVRPETRPSTASSYPSHWIHRLRWLAQGNKLVELILLSLSVIFQVDLDLVIHLVSDVLTEKAGDNTQTTES